MSDLSQLPARVNLVFHKRDGLNPVTITFDKDLTGYTFAAQIEPSTGTAIDLTVDDDDAAEGVVIVSLDAEDAAGLTIGAEYTWYLQWEKTGTETLTVLSGSVTVL